VQALAHCVQRAPAGLIARGGLSQERYDAQFHDILPHTSLLPGSGAIAQRGVRLHPFIGADRSAEGYFVGQAANRAELGEPVYHAGAGALNADAGL